MKNEKTLELFEEVISSPHYLPCVSVIIPFEPKMGLKKEIDHKLKVAIDKVEKLLLKDYSQEKSDPIVKRLRRILSEVNYFTHKKSIAVFVSPLIEKTYYLDIPVEEKIIIDESFEIRDLIYSKKEMHKYLLAVLSSKWSKVYLGNTSHFVRIALNIPDRIEAYQNEISEKIANFSDEQKRKEILLDKFLRHTDNAISQLLKTFNLPLFVMGTVRTIGHFKSLTHNSRNVIDYVQGNFEDHTETELAKAMAPYLQNWKAVKQKELMKQIEESLNNKKLSVGIGPVWRSASQKKGRLLVVEKNYIYPAQHGSEPEVIFGRDEALKNAFYIKDAVDDIIEKVISSGGDVEFVDEGVLDKYGKIVLIEYYGFYV